MANKKPATKKPVKTSVKRKPKARIETDLPLGEGAQIMADREAAEKAAKKEKAYG